MPASQSAEDLAQQARFVFRGTVQKLRAATMEEVPTTDRTAVVHVDEIIHAPKLLSSYGDKDITVFLSDSSNVKEGDSWVFFTNPSVFGKSIAVESIGQHPVGPEMEALRATQTDPVKNLANRDMRNHLAESDLVILGQVVSVSLPQDQMSADQAGANTFLQPREHDPHWREAVIRIISVPQGRYAQKTIVVRFPGSNDILWAHIPKLQPGQEGYFILHRRRSSAPQKGKAQASKTRAKDRANYLLLHAEDFQSIHQPGGIQTILSATPSTKNT
ncbi:MAG TPA: hypothetical protein VFA07_09075 [Chthonomonadaceae bacterium]|nr:hypothetical protein [Chthonomonadaceae bacterium]